MSNEEVLELFATGELQDFAHLPSRHSPFEMDEYKYIKFAEADIQEAEKSTSNNIHNLVNAISNTKRSLDCRVDTLLDFWGIRHILKVQDIRCLNGEMLRRNTFPAKLEALQQAGVVAPRLLRKINRYRNETEHDYRAPEIDQVADYVDVVQLFLESSRRYITIEPDGMLQLFTASGDCNGAIDFKIARPRGVLTIDYDLDQPSGHMNGVIKINPSNDLAMYLKFLKVWHKATTLSDDPDTRSVIQWG